MLSTFAVAARAVESVEGVGEDRIKVSCVGGTARRDQSWSVRIRRARPPRASRPELLILTLMAQCPSRLCAVGRGGLP